MPADQPRWTGRVVIAGAVLTIAAFVGVGLLGGTAWRAWLGAAFLAASAPIGALALVMMIRIVPGDWGRTLEGPARSLAALTIPGLALLLPVLLRLGVLYPWVGAHQETAFRAAYFTVGGFALRSLAWGGVFAVLSLLMAVRQGGGPLAAAGLMLFVLLGHLAATDWLLSLDPEFSSSGFGLWVICLQILTALSLSILAVCAGRRSVEGLGGVLTAVLLVWIYMSFMHYVIIWSGDLPKGVAWYQRRGDASWSAVIWVCAACRLVPTFMLFFSPLRQNRRWLAVVAGIVAGGSVLEMAWLVLPATHPAPGGLDGLLYGLALAGMALLGLGAFLWLRPRLALFPERALEEVAP